MRSITVTAGNIQQRYEDITELRLENTQVHYLQYILMITLMSNLEVFPHHRLAVCSESYITCMQRCTVAEYLSSVQCSHRQWWQRREREGGGGGGEDWRALCSRKREREWKWQVISKEQTWALWLDVRCFSIKRGALWFCKKEDMLDLIRCIFEMWRLLISPRPCGSVHWGCDLISLRRLPPSLVLAHFVCLWIIWTSRAENEKSADEWRVSAWLHYHFRHLYSSVPRSFLKQVCN